MYVERRKIRKASGDAFDPFAISSKEDRQIDPIRGPSTCSIAEEARGAYKGVSAAAAEHARLARWVVRLQPLIASKAEAAIGFLDDGAGRAIPRSRIKRAFARLFRRKILERPFGIVHLTTPGSIEATILFAEDQGGRGEPVVRSPRAHRESSENCTRSASRTRRCPMPEPAKLPIKRETSSAVAGPAPWNSFELLRREIDHVFDNFGWRLWPPIVTGPMFQTDFLRKKAWDIAPAVDVAEKEKEFEITAELPGLDEKNVEVKLGNGTLIIKGEKKEEKEEREKDYYLSERRYGSFIRSFPLPEGVNADKIEATFAKGVLTIKLPKTAEAQAEKKIPVKAA